MFRYSVFVLLLGLSSMRLSTAKPEVQCYGASVQMESDTPLEKSLSIEELITRILKHKEDCQMCKFCQEPNVCTGANFYVELNTEAEYYAYIGYSEGRREFVVRVEDENDDAVLDFQKTEVSESDLTAVVPYRSSFFKMDGKDCVVTIDGMFPNGERRQLMVVNLCTVCL
ncbi:uncharacterized protein LOC110986188 [Acanthaster planci]|uniref:Uncharacterized protein LOC110986188 n=1 Tax=Acanthaster planci TaxID=133434 RepID=A0A8B7ZD08_ACAPL|nr:uncharacterized protein LOC110986188 [Acanthaster planci]